MIDTEDTTKLQEQ